MKTKGYLLAIVIILIEAKSSWAQPNTTYLSPLDNYLGSVDTSMIKQNIKEMDCYQCYIISGKDSCIINKINTYDNKGRLVSSKIWDNSDENNVSEVARYKYKDNSMEINKKFFPITFTDRINHYYLLNITPAGLSEGLKYKLSKDSTIELNAYYEFRENKNIGVRRFNGKELVDSFTIVSHTEPKAKSVDSITTLLDKTIISKYDDSFFGKFQVLKKFNLHDKILEEHKVVIDSAKKVVLLSLKTIYLYDFNGNLKEELYVNNDNCTDLSSKKYTYDNADKLVSIVEEKTGNMTTKYVYDSLHRLIEFSQKIQGWNEPHVSKFYYDVKSDLLMKVESYDGSTLKSYMKYEYKK
jgi:YD repeat-containing protein